MEAIIIFVIMIIISNVLKNLKGSGRPAGRRPFPGPPSLPAHLPEKDPGGRKPVYRKVENLELYFEKPEKDLPPPRTGAVKERKKIVPPRALKAAKKAAPPVVSSTVSLAKGSSEKVSLTGKTGETLELKGLISSGKLPAFIVASEILAAPRSREPYRFKYR